jgi:hypothetical protein
MLWRDVLLSKVIFIINKKLHGAHARHVLTSHDEKTKKDTEENAMFGTNLIINIRISKRPGVHRIL